MPHSILKGFHHPEAFLEYCYPGTNFPGSSVVKKSACNAGESGDMGSSPGLGRSPKEGNGNSLQYACLENSMEGAWQATVQGVPELDMNEQLSMHVSIEAPIYSWAVSPYFLQLFPHL